MTTKEEYAKAAGMCEAEALCSISHSEQWSMIANVLRQLADGAVLCEKTKPGPMDDVDAIYTPIEE